MKELLRAYPLKHISYADKPLPQLSPEDTIQTLSPQEFFEKFHVQYSESLHGEPKEIQQILAKTDLTSLAAGRPDTPSEALIIERLKNPLEGLVICKMDEVGYGLFTQRSIPRNTILFLYSGVVDDAQTSDNFDLKRDTDYRWMPHTPKVINATQIGGLARFMQHFPCDYEKKVAQLEEGLKNHPQAALFAHGLQKQGSSFRAYANEIMEPYKSNDDVKAIPFDDEAIKKQMLTSCIKLTSVVVRGFPVVICTTEEDLAANAQLGFAYGKAYWRCRKEEPRYFFPDGTLIPLTAYRNAADMPATSPKLLAGIIAEDPRKSYDAAVALYKAKDYSRATALLKSAIKTYEKHGKNEELATCYDTLASCQRELKQNAEAIDSCKKAIALRQEILTKNPANSAEIALALDKSKTKLANLAPQLGSVFSTASKQF